MQAIRWGDLTQRENSSGDGRNSPSQHGSSKNKKKIKIIKK
jgi:hypothetical protein